MVEEWAATYGVHPLTKHKVPQLGPETVLIPGLWTDDDRPILGNDGKIEMEHELKGGFKQKDRVSWNVNNVD